MSKQTKVKPTADTEQVGLSDLLYGGGDKDETQLYIEKMTADGYIGKDGEPLKCCFCESDDLEPTQLDFCNHDLCEYDIRCKNCKKIVGHWAYGVWDI